MIAEWKPMDTAPKDGTYVFLSCRGGIERISPGYYNRGEWHHLYDEDDILYPTHWDTYPDGPEI